MKHPDEAVEKVLAGLRDVEAPSDMNRRILRMAHARATASSSSSWLRFSPRWAIASPRQILVWCLVCSILIVTAVVIPAWRRLPHKTEDTKLGSTAPALQAPPQPERATSHQQPSLLRKSHLQATAQPKLRRARGAEAGDYIATSETQAVSFPAPPMPLTDQEKLLLRLVHKGDPVEMAELDPVMRDKQYADGKAEFHRFFDPPAAAAENK
jgi:hypothetical protein